MPEEVVNENKTSKDKAEVVNEEQPNSDKNTNSSIEKDFHYCPFYGFHIYKGDNEFKLSLMVSEENGNLTSEEYTLNEDIVKNLTEKHPDLGFVKAINYKKIDYDTDTFYRVILTVDIEKFRTFNKALGFFSGVEINGVNFTSKSCYTVDHQFSKYIFQSKYFNTVLTYLLPYLEEENEGAKNGDKGAKTILVSDLKQALKEVLEDENSDLIRVIKDCPYIPIRSLDGKDGAVYKDGEFIYLDKIGKTFKVLGSFHIVRDTDLNLATCYALGIDKEPSLILPEVVLKQLKGGG